VKDIGTAVFLGWREQTPIHQPAAKAIKIVRETAAVSLVPEVKGIRTPDRLVKL
jgi:hypothetical protein